PGDRSARVSPLPVVLVDVPQPDHRGQKPESRRRVNRPAPPWTMPGRVDYEERMADAMITSDPAQASPRFFGPTAEVAPGVLMQAAFVNTYAVTTPAGLVIVDPGFTHTTTTLRDAVRQWSAAPLRTAIYTHGHVDHALGLGAFLDAGEHPDILAPENCLARFRRYGEMHGWN